ncbi:MAG: Hsp20/alpha crystallin family protein [Proteobacteria bacterium]|nr:Hsp20/alpha crystallin family protein [Pseudomonadota bacterium]
MNAPAKIPVRRAAPAAWGFPNVFGSLQHEIDRLFDDFSPAFAGSRDGSEVRCHMDLADTKDGLELTIEVPGLDEKDVNVSVSDGLLTVSGEKRFETKQEDRNYRFVERGYGSFSRSVPLPEGVKADDIKANLSKGVLKVVVPTPAKAEPKKIQVQATV